MTMLIVVQISGNFVEYNYSPATVQIGVIIGAVVGALLGFAALVIGIIVLSCCCVFTGLGALIGCACCQAAKKRADAATEMKISEKADP